MNWKCVILFIELLPFRLAGAAFALIGLGIIVAAVIWHSKLSQFNTRAARAPGTVVEIQRHQFELGDPTFTPIFNFADANGKSHSRGIGDGLGAVSADYKVGDAVTVLYDPADPDNAMIDTTLTPWAPLFVACFGLIFAGFAVGWLFCVERAAARRSLTGDAT